MAVSLKLWVCDLMVINWFWGIKFFPKLILIIKPYCLISRHWAWGEWDNFYIIHIESSRYKSCLLEGIYIFNNSDNLLSKRDKIGNTAMHYASCLKIIDYRMV